MPSVEQNIKRWDSKFKDFIQDEDYGYRWSMAWGSPLLQWYSTIFPRVVNCLPVQHIYEIGSGLGRWSEFLMNYCKYLTLSDISDQSIRFLEKNYGKNKKVRVVKTIGNKITAKSKIDFLFSFDSLVHCDYDIICDYIDEFEVNASGKSNYFFHHSNLASCSIEVSEKKQNGWRSKNVSYINVRKKISEKRLGLVSQELIDWGAVVDYLDCMTLISNLHNQKPIFIENNKFMNNARKVNAIKGKIYKYYKTIYLLRRLNLLPLRIEKVIISKVNKKYGIN